MLYTVTAKTDKLHDCNTEPQRFPNGIIENENN